MEYEPHLTIDYHFRISHQSELSWCCKNCLITDGTNAERQAVCTQTIHQVVTTNDIVMITGSVFGEGGGV